MRLDRLNPFTALRDLTGFVGQQRRHKIGFLALALAATWAILYGFFRDSQFERPYKREIIYFESWPLDRSDAEIRAQQQVDLKKKQIEDARLQAKLRKRQEEFKKVDDALKRVGI